MSRPRPSLHVLLTTLALLPSAALAHPGPQGADLEERARVILVDNCARCHASTAQRVRGGFGNVDQLDELVGAGLVEPGNPAASLLFELVDSGDMPEDGDRLAQDDIDLIAKWIRSLAPGMRVPALTHDALLDRIEADLGAVREQDRTYLRYLSLANLWNLGEPEETLEYYRMGVLKLLNSLSWAPDLVRMEWVGEERALLRVDLRQLARYGGQSWDEGLWETILIEGGEGPGGPLPYTYGVLSGSSQEERLLHALHTSVPYVRADWFAFATTRPRLYHHILGLPGPERAADTLEDYLGVDVAANIDHGRALRAGIRQGQSGVSHHNRLIERHAIRREGYAERAYYWKSYDFSASAGEKQLLTRPFGPRSLTGGARDFEHDGGEIIFSLPNGLQAYLLVDAQGNRIDEGPSDIVFDDESATRKKGVIVNGISCMNCHGDGTIPTTDAVRPYTVETQRGRTAHLEAVEALYPRQELLSASLEADRARFVAALAELGFQVRQRPGAGPTSVSDELGEAVTALSRAFERPLSLQRAASELGLSPKEMQNELGRRNHVRATLATGTMAREEFQLQFPDVVEILNMGTVHQFRELQPAAYGDPKQSPGQDPEPISRYDPVRTNRLRVLAAGSVLTEEVLTLAKNSRTEIAPGTVFAVVAGFEHDDSELRREVLTQLLSRDDVDPNGVGESNPLCEALRVSEWREMNPWVVDRLLEHPRIWPGRVMIHSDYEALRSREIAYTYDPDYAEKLAGVQDKIRLLDHYAWKLWGNTVSR